MTKFDEPRTVTIHGIRSMDEAQEGKGAWLYDEDDNVIAVIYKSFGLTDAQTIRTPNPPSPDRT